MNNHFCIMADDFKKRMYALASNEIMRKFGLITMCFVAFASVCHADVVSWNWDNQGTVGNPDGSYSADVAGVVPAANWNNSWWTYDTVDLMDDTGAETSIDIAWSSYNDWSILGYHVGADADGTYNRELLNGYLNSGPADWDPGITYSEVVLSQIPYLSYDIIVYFSSDLAGREGDVTDGTTTYSFNTLGPASVSGSNAVLVQTTDTAGTYLSAANYAVFSGLSGASQTVRVQMRDDDEWGGIAAVQISGEGEDSTPPTPDPATWADEPHATGADTVQMTTTIGTDAISAPVEYYFEETSGHTGGGDSGWITNTTYIDYGLVPLETYTYIVRMRDAVGNVTGDSTPVSVTTGPVPDADGSGIVDMNDFANYSANWLDTDCSGNVWCNGSDFDLSGNVDISDLSIFCSAWLQGPGLGHFHGWAPTPPMGWNSWDCFGTSVTEDEVKANADYMAEYLKQYGWEYVIVDIQWYEPQVESNPYNYPYPPDTNIDDYGRVWPAVNKHPSSADGNGFTLLADYVHSLGLKFGVHMMRGIPRVAYDRDTPILGTPYTARDIVDTSSTCSWNPDMYGVDTTQPGAQEYYNSVFDLVAGWGVDYVKIDDLSRPYHPEEIEAIRNAIDQCGRPIVLSTSPGATPLSAGEHVSQHANLWRISDDFWDNWSALDAQFQRLHDWSQWNADGHYPDADMLPLGNVRARSSGWTNFTETEQKTMMTLWAIARSPLMMGGHMPNNDAYTLSLMINSELLEVNQHSFHNRSIQNNSYPIWIADVPDSNDMYLAVFNRTSTGPTPVPVTLSNLGINRCNVRDLWTHTDLGEFTDNFSPNVDSHGAELYKLTVMETTL